MSDTDSLRLDRQLCFPLYVASRLVTKHYAPLLAELDITYPQYLVLLVLWETDGRSVQELGDRLYLETNTVTPLLKRMERKGLLTRRRATDDERRVVIQLTPAGRDLRERAACIPAHLIDTLQDAAPDAQRIAAFNDTLNRLISLLSNA